MARELEEKMIKAIEYLALPFQYPHRFRDLFGKVFSNRTLVHELPRITPHRDWLQSAGIQTVVDVGAFIGSFAYAIRHVLPEAQIYSFEPLPENFDLLLKNLNPLGKFQGFRSALGDKTGELTFHKNDFSPSSSVLEMAELHRVEFPYASHFTKVNVPVACLDDFLPRMELKEKILLKVDVQGYEDVVLRSGIKLLKQVDYLITEVSYHPLYEGQVLFDQLYDFLRTQGFTFSGLLDSMFSPRDGSILQSDALFIRCEDA